MRHLRKTEFSPLRALRNSWFFFSFYPAHLWCFKLMGVVFSTVRYGGALQNLTLKLPVTINKFFQPTEMASQDFFQRWKQLSQWVCVMGVTRFPRLSSHIGYWPESVCDLQFSFTSVSINYSQCCRKVLLPKNYLPKNRQIIFRQLPPTADDPERCCWRSL